MLIQIRQPLVQKERIGPPCQITNNVSSIVRPDLSILEETCTLSISSLENLRSAKLKKISSLAAGSFMARWSHRLSSSLSINSNASKTRGLYSTSSCNGKGFQSPRFYVNQQEFCWRETGLRFMHIVCNVSVNFA